MAELISYLNRTGFGREAFSISLNSLTSWPPDLNLPSPHFTLLLACDARGISDTDIRSFANLLITQGIAYFCTWGPDCERVHDLMDLVVVQREEEEGREFPIMTSWHNDETLDNALWFMLEAACPDEVYADLPSCCLYRNGENTH